MRGIALAARPQRGARRAGRIAKPKVFVTSDDADVLASLKFVLGAAGFEVRTFLTGPALLASRSKRDADCFILPHKMRGMDGLELARRLRGAKITAPIVLMTGFPGVGLEAAANAAGVGRVSLTPHVDEELIRSVTLAIGERRGRSNLRASP